MGFGFFKIALKKPWYMYLEILEDTVEPQSCVLSQIVLAPVSLPRRSSNESLPFLVYPKIPALVEEAGKTDSGQTNPTLSGFTYQWDHNSIFRFCRKDVRRRRVAPFCLMFSEVPDSCLRSVAHFPTLPASGCAVVLVFVLTLQTTVEVSSPVLAVEYSLL